MDFSYIVAPAVGALIGYITNYIAIKMLFRPLEVKYLFGIHIPFTPGIIPREKARLAKSIGEVVGEKLLTHGVILQAVTSPFFQDKIENFIDQKLQEIKNTNMKVENMMHYVLDAEESKRFITLIEKDATKFLYNKLNSPEVTDKLTRHISQGIDDYIQKQFGNSVFKLLVGLNKGLVNSIKNIITHRMKELLYADSYAVLENLVEDELHSILNMPMDDLLNHWENKSYQVKKVIMNAFNRAIQDNIKTITSTLDLSSIVENRIQDFDVEEVETLILSVVEKELKAIIWLGALLGMVMGLLMPLFS